MKTFYLVRVNRNPSDTHAAESPEDARELAMPDPGDVLEFATTEAEDAGAARLADVKWHVISGGKPLGATPHYHCPSLRLYGYPTLTDLWRAMDQKLKENQAHLERRSTMKTTLTAAILALTMTATANAAPCKVNVNTATPAELAYLIRTGPVLAGAITAGRPYADMAALDGVKGIGEAWLRYNADHVTLDGATTCTSKLSKPKPEKAPAIAAPTQTPATSGR